MTGSKDPFACLLSEAGQQPDAEALYRTLFEQSTESIVLVDPETGRMLAFNRKAHDNLGYTRKEFDQLSIPDFDIIDSRQEVDYRIRSILQNGSAQFETRHRHKNGEIRTILVSSNMVPTTTRPLIQSVWRDVTDERRVESDLRHRLDALTHPDGDPEDLCLTDLIDLSMLQEFQDSFAASFKIPAIIYGTDGLPITKPSNYSDFCSIMRSTRKGRIACEAFDKSLANHCQPDRKPFVRVGCVMENMITGTIPIFVKENHLANITIGQMTAGKPEPEQIRDHAREIGADEELLLQAARALPTKTREHFDAILTFLGVIANQLSLLAISNLQQATVIQKERNREAEVVRAKELFEKTFNCQPDAIFILDTASPPDIISVNRAAVNMFGYPGEAFSEQPVSMVGIEFQTLLELQGSLDYTDPLSPDLVSEYHCPLQRMDGSRFPAEVHIISLEDGNHVRSGWILRVRDLTDTIRAIETVNDREKNLRDLVEKSINGIMICSPDGAILFCNRQAAAISGYPPEDLDRMNIIELLPFNRHETVDLLAVDPAVDPAADASREVKIPRADGTNRTVDLNIMATSWQKQKARLIFLRDITEKKLEQERLIQTSKMISLGTLVSGVAHEINNPNNFIMLNIPLLKEVWDSVDPILAEHARRGGDFEAGGLPFSEMRSTVPKLFSGVQEGAERIKRIVRDLKNFSRPRETDKTNPVDLNMVVGAALTLVNNLVRKSTDHFTVHYALDLPSLSGDPQQLEQVVINLVQNACQALQNREQAVTVSTKYDRKQQQIRIVVRDEGVGIDQDALPRLTDPFFTTRREQGGTGLGLSVSSAIIRSHDGSLDIETLAEGGSRFTVSLPLKKRKAVKSILLVDDEAIVRKMLRMALDRQGNFRIIEAGDGVEACIRIGEHHPDLMIIDIQMPNMNGVEVIRRVKSEPEFADIKIIVLTGLLTPAVQSELNHLGVDQCRVKPLEAEKFIEEVVALLEPPPP